MRHRLPNALDLLERQANDAHPRVRLEAVVAVSHFATPKAASIALEALRHPTDKFLDYALAETIKELDEQWRSGLRDGSAVAADNRAGMDYLLRRFARKPAEMGRDWRSCLVTRLPLLIPLGAIAPALGVSDELIDTIDPDGVALAAIQGLHELVLEKDAEIAELRTRQAALEAKLAAVIGRLDGQGTAAAAR